MFFQDNSCLQKLHKTFVNSFENHAIHSHRILHRGYEGLGRFQSSVVARRGGDGNAGLLVGDWILDRMRREEVKGEGAEMSVWRSGGE